MINHDCNEQIGFITGINKLIIKNVKSIGAKRSFSDDKILIKHRKHFVSQWFQRLPGIHNNEEISKPPPVTKLEIKTDFNCLLIKLNDNRQFDLKGRLENVYNDVLKLDTDVVYTILNFLLSLQRTNEVEPDHFYHFEKVNLPTDIRLYGDSRSVKIPENSLNIFTFYPNKFFTQDAIRKQFAQPESILLKDDYIDDSMKFISELSNGPSIKLSPVTCTTSGYCSEVDDVVLSTDISDQKESSSTVRYPFSKFCGKEQHFSDYWEEEIVAEWEAFKEGKELPRRFVWEDRGRNVGAEKPRVTEWRPDVPLTGCAISKALFFQRYTNGAEIGRYLAVDSVPLADWIKDVLALRLGISSATFVYDQKNNQFYLASEVPRYLLEQLQPHITAGTIFARLSLLVYDRNIFKNVSFVRDRLLSRLSELLSMHRQILSKVECDFSSLSDFGVFLGKFTQQIEYLGCLLEADPASCPSWPALVPPTSPLHLGGIPLLRHLHDTAAAQIAHPFFSLTFFLFEGCLNVVLEQLSHWLYQGELQDCLLATQVTDFLVTSHPRYETCMDSRWWTHAFLPHLPPSSSQSPWILDRILSNIIRCGKSIRLLKLIDPTHPLFHDQGIISRRPILHLSYSYRDEVDGPVREYLVVARAVVEDHRLACEQRKEEERSKAKSVEREARVARETVLAVERAERVDQQREDRRRRAVDLVAMKDAADEEIRMKREKVERERADDRQLMERVKNENRGLLEEIKYEMTLLYAKKFADAEAREKESLKKIADYENRLLKNVEKSIPKEDQEEGPRQVVSDLIKEYVKEYLPESSPINAPMKVETLPDNLNEKVNLQGHPDKLSVGRQSISQVEGALNKDKHIERFKEINAGGHSSESTAQKSLYPSDTEIKKEPSHLIDDFRQINSHGHPSVSTVDRSLYSAEKESNFVDNFRQINSQGHSSMSTAQKSLYPSSNSDVKEEPSHSIDDFRHINTHGHPSVSTVDRSLYSAQKESNFVDNFRQINSQGHSSISTAQKSLYPDIHQGGEGEPLTVDNFRILNIHGHSSQSTAQESLYPHQGGDPDPKEHARISRFKDINRQGHSSQSTIQKLLYPDRDAAIVHPIDPRQPPSSSEGQWPDKPPSDFVKSIYAVDFSAISRPINLSFLPPDADPAQDQAIELEEELLETLLDRSLLGPIMGHIGLVDEVITTTLMDQFRIREHLVQVRRYLFLQDGHFSSSLLADLFDLLSRSRSVPGVRFSSERLKDIVRAAVNCRHGPSEACLCHHVTSSLAAGPRNRLDLFSVSYETVWPLNLVISDRQQRQYESVFGAVVQMKHAAWCLEEARRRLLRPRRGVTVAREVHVFLWQVGHWVRAFDAGLGGQVALGDGNHGGNHGEGSLDDVMRAHAARLDAVVMRCLLAGDDLVGPSPPPQVMRVRAAMRTVVKEMLAMATECHRLVVNGDHRPIDKEAVVNLHRRFRTLADCLLAVLRGAPPSSPLGRLLVALDYNRYYGGPVRV